ncbi:MAG: hypothetical protein JSS55_11540 [Proteobacteria bacterium]|nr:hypothetical protein [Pseudomonadota bacterium]
MALTALTSLSGTARAANEDVRCLLASNLFTKAEKDPAKRQVALLSSYFYLGRVDARLSGQQLAIALKAEAGTITPESAGPTMTACAKRVQGAGAAIQVLGKDLQAGK